ncbi:GM18516 [Drosophila sechellia]|uniref:GM18516 n=1 Tax=Drosophila sechellia TaxID=7238 RepID=B4I1B4_DROSE|nr:GM18516 [Drosophila sechellia]
MGLITKPSEFLMSEYRKKSKKHEPQGRAKTEAMCPISKRGLSANFEMEAGSWDLEAGSWEPESWLKVLPGRCSGGTKLMCY